MTLFKLVTFHYMVSETEPTDDFLNSFYYIFWRRMFYILKTNHFIVSYIKSYSLFPALRRDGAV